MITVSFFKFNPESIPRLRKWGYSLMDTFKEEALHSLALKKITFEAMYLVNREYVMGITKSNTPKPPKLNLRINRDSHIVLEKMNEVPLLEKVELIYQLKK